MKKILIILSVLFCTTVFAHTIEWYVGDNLLSTTTCESGDNITPPNAPEKFGYHFKKWDGYMPIEYLESTGTQYIDTGINPNNYTRVIIKYFYYQGLDFVFGSRKDFFVDAFADLIVQMEDSSYKFRSDYGTQRAHADINLNSVNNSVVTIDKNKKNSYLYDEEYRLLTSTTNPSQTFVTQYPIVLFGLNTDGEISIKRSSRIYSCKLYDNDILVRDFIPVLDKNGTPCMFDKVEHKFYYNAGTGQFIAGPFIGE